MGKKGREREREREREKSRGKKWTGTFMRDESAISNKPSVYPGQTRY